MSKLNLKSSTALLVTVALSMPAPIIAQTAEQPFPCVSPSGAEVSDADGLAQDLMVFAQAGGSLDAAGTCPAEALDQALAIGGDSLTAAFAPPAEVVEPEVVEEVTPEVEPEVVEAEVEPVPEVEPEAVEAEAEPVPEVEPEVVEVEPAPEGEVEAVEAEVAPEAVEAEVEVAPEVVPDAAPEVVEAEVAPVEAAPEAEVPAETAPVEAVEPAAPEVVEAPAAAQEQVATETPAPEQAPVTEAGEAGGEELSDEERQELATAREEAQVESAAAAAETEAETGDAAEVITETIAEEDVRKSDEDFDTAVTANVDATAQAEGKDRGLSNFEKALLLGLGAAVVGTVLNNGDQVVSNSGDRVIVERDGELRVLKNDDELLQRPGTQVQTQTFNDGSTRTVLTYEDGSQIITVRASDGSVLRRTLIQASDGSEVVLFDDTQKASAVDFAELPTLEALEAEQRALAANNNDALAVALQRALLADVGRSFSLQQVRDYKRVRALAPQVEIEAVTFASGSAAIEPSQAEALRDLALGMREIIANRPGSVFLIEGHTDAVGRAGYNLALSDRRAETVALALTEYFAVPPQNLITQGYGESDLKIPVLSDERANRRAVVRNITGLLN